jgi:hypothetical protein
VPIRTSTLTFSRSLLLSCSFLHHSEFLSILTRIPILSKTLSKTESVQSSLARQHLQNDADLQTQAKQSYLKGLDIIAKVCDSGKNWEYIHISTVLSDRSTCHNSKPPPMSGSHCPRRDMRMEWILPLLTTSNGVYWFLQDVQCFLCMISLHYQAHKCCVGVVFYDCLYLDLFQYRRHPWCSLRR